MYETIKRLYTAKRLDKAGVQKAVKRGWITATQYKEIVGEAYA
ncbi:XkdX family protein [uncultured Agathobaculum sp.]